MITLESSIFKGLVCFLLYSISSTFVYIIYSCSGLLMIQIRWKQWLGYA